MIKSKLFDLLTEKDKEKLREICRLLSRSLTARDINECMTCLQKIDGGDGGNSIANAVKHRGGRKSKVCG